MATLEIAMLAFAIPVALYGDIRGTIRIVQNVRENKRAALRHKCKGCGSILSEWFTIDDGRMRCFICGTVSEHKGHPREA